jgi:DNA-binding MarR family transcriptional regulator
VNFDPSVNSHDVHTREILAEIECGTSVTQRSLAKRLGIALGLTNSLVRRLVNKGYVKVVNVRPNRVKYLITPAGIAEKARATRSYLARTIHLYLETRQHIHNGLLAAARNGNGGGPVRVVFYGADEIAEIAYICLQETNLELVGVIDDRKTGSFFGAPIHSPAALREMQVDGVPFDRLIVVSLGNTDEIRARLRATGCPDDHICWLE